MSVDCCLRFSKAFHEFPNSCLNYAENHVFFGGSHQTIISTWQKIKPQFSVLASMVKKCAKPPVLGTFITMELPIKMASLRWVIQPQGPQPLETSPPPLRGELSERQESEWHRFHWRGSWKVPDSSSPGKAAGFDGKSTTEHQGLVYAFILFNPVALIKKESVRRFVDLDLFCCVPLLKHCSMPLIHNLSQTHTAAAAPAATNNNNDDDDEEDDDDNNSSNNNNNKIKRSATAAP